MGTLLVKSRIILTAVSGSTTWSSPLFRSCSRSRRCSERGLSPAAESHARVIVGLIDYVVGGFGERLLGILGYDQAPNGARESNVIGGPILLLQLGHIMVVYLAGRAGHRETIAIAGGAAQGSRGEAAQPDGWMRFLNRFRRNFDVLEIEEIALVGDRLSTEKTRMISSDWLVRAPRSLKGTPKLRTLPA